MTDIESIRKRHEALTAPTGQAHARAVMKRHAPDDIACLLGEVERLTAALATAKDEERAAVVAWLRGEAHFTDVGPLDTFADAYADGIEAGRHREKA